jgi:RNA polymerase sigma-70 factor (ECF subfamily)
MDYDKLIIETSKGDLTSLEKLYRDLGPVVFGFAYSILNSRTQAEDVLQDTFVRVKLSAVTYKPGTNGRAWIMTIARNSAISIIRNRRFETQMEELEAVESDGIDHMQKSIDSILLNQALSILDEQERQIVLLHAIKDFKHREIAEITDIPLGTVLWKYHKAIKKMSKHLKTESVKNT